MASSTKDSPYDPSIVICKEIKDSKWNGGMNPPNFDFTPALSHAGLVIKLGGTDVEVRDKIETKMNALDQKIKSFEFKFKPLHTSIVTLSFALLIMTFINTYIGVAQLFGQMQNWTYKRTKDPLVWTEMILIFILFCLWCRKRRIAAKRNEKFSRMVDDHFIDWKEKGINVELQYKEDSEGYGDFDQSKLRSLKIFIMPSNDKC